MLQQRTLRRAATWGPGLIAGAFESLRHIYLEPLLPQPYGNVLTIVVVISASALFLLQIFRLMDQSDRELRLEQARNTVLQERDRIAGDLHDGMSQSLFFLNVKVRDVEKSLSEQDEAAARMHLGEMQGVVGDLYEKIRQTIFDLKATQGLVGPNFGEAIRRYLNDFSNQSGIAVEVERLVHVCRPDCPEVELDILRILQEALVNARRHGQAKRIRVSLHSDIHQDLLIVQDDGLGFDPATASGEQDGHFGLALMRERARRVGGNLHVESRPGNGTLIRFERLVPNGRVSA